MILLPCMLLSTVPTIKFGETPRHRHVTGPISSQSALVSSQTKHSIIQFMSSRLAVLRIGGNISRPTPHPLVLNIAPIICSMFRPYRWSEVLRVMY